MGGLTGKRTHLDAAESTTQTARQLPIKIKPGTSLEDSKAIAFGRDLPPLSLPTSEGAINPRNGPLTSAYAYVLSCIGLSQASLSWRRSGRG